MRKASQEHSFQVWAVNYLRWNGVYCFAVPNGGKRDVKTGAFLKKEGALSGVADLILLLPEGEAVFVELKAGKNRQQESQRLFQKHVEKLGFNYLLWNKPQDVIDFVKGLKAVVMGDFTNEKIAWQNKRFSVTQKAASDERCGAARVLLCGFAHCRV